MTSRPLWRRSVAAALFALLVGPGSGTALGHAELDTVTPADASTVEGPPVEVVMTFTEALKPANSSIKLVDAGGKVVVEGSTVDAADPKVMRLAIPATLAPGTYTARWTSASAVDGDLDHGTTTFTVTAAASVAPSSAPTVSASATPPSPESSTAAPGSAAASPAPSSPPTSPAASTSDAIIPIVAALIVIGGIGLWLLRGRSRTGA